MTITAKILHGLGPRETLAKVKLAAIPSIGDNLYFNNESYEVAVIDHFAVNAEEQGSSELTENEGEPFVVIVVKWRD